MLRLILDLLVDTDEPPERLGLVGVAILATFTVFCAVVWFVHTPAAPLP